MRGGSWIDNARNVRAAYRNDNDPANRNDNLGFRCARAHERIGESAPEQTGLHGVAGLHLAFAETHSRPACR
jgi:hypothetical protein